MKEGVQVPSCLVKRDANTTRGIRDLGKDLTKSEGIKFVLIAIWDERSYQYPYHLTAYSQKLMIYPPKCGPLQIM